MENFLPEPDMENMRTNRKMQRRVTDSGFRFVFLGYSGLWLALLVGVNILRTRVDPQAQEFGGNVVSKIETDGYKIPIRILLGIVLYVAFIFAAKSCSGFFTRVGILFTYLLLGLEITQMVFVIVFGAIRNGQWFHLTDVPGHLLTISWFVAAIIGLKKVGLETISKTLQDSCRAILFYPQSLLLGIAGTVLVWMFIAMTYFVHEHLGNLNDSTNLVSLIVSGLRVFNWLACFWWCMFIVDLVGLVSRVAYITWYSAENKQTLTMADLNEQIYSAIRYQLGTLCFGSSILSVMVNVGTIFESESLTLNNIKKRPIILACVLQLLVPWVYFNDIIYTVMVIYGTDFRTSAHKALDLVVRNPWKYYVPRFFAQYVAFLGFVLVMTPFVVDLVVMMAQAPAIEHNDFLISAIVLLFVSMAAGAILCIFWVAISSINICYVYDEQKNDILTNPFVLSSLNV